jgi:antitoxin ParD1/3/4
MEISLAPELEKFVAAKVAAGLYGSASEMVCEALRLLQEQDRAQSAAFSQALGTRPPTPDRTERFQAETVRERLRQRSEERRRLSA